MVRDLFAELDARPWPLVLDGLVLDYLPDRGHFDAWCADPGPLGGARLDLGALDLIQSRNHLLRNAIAALPESGRRLLAN